MSKHVKGPWAVHNNNDVLVLDAEGNRVVDMYTHDYDAAQEQARLIAIAPDMQALLSVFAGVDEHDADLIRKFQTKARKLLAKVEAA
jgi:hypothetical protein